ncbi:MAG: DUF6516 family protein [bacterium]
MSGKYLQQLEQKLRNWNYTTEITIVREKRLADIDAGYIRIRARLKNDNLLEISEYVVASENDIIRESYSFHWQDSDGKLIYRWDNAPHHPQVATFPHQVHSQTESNIAATEIMSLDRVIKRIEQTIIS